MFKKIKEKFSSMCAKVAVAVMNYKAEGYVDTGVKILISVVIGALLLSLLYGLFNKTIMPTVTKKITDLFNFKG